MSIMHSLRLVEVWKDPSLAMSVGEALLEQTAMLLPQLYATFERARSHTPSTGVGYGLGVHYHPILSNI